MLTAITPDEPRCTCPTFPPGYFAGTHYNGFPVDQPHKGIDIDCRACNLSPDGRALLRPFAHLLQPAQTGGHVQSAAHTQVSATPYLPSGECTDERT